MVTHLQYATNGSLVVGTANGRVLVCSLESGTLLHDYLTEPAHSVTYLPAGNQLLFAHTDNAVRLRSLDGSLLRTISGHTTSTTLGVAFSPDRQHVLTAGVEPNTRLWNRTNAQEVQTFLGDGAGSSVAAFSPDGRVVVTTLGFPQKLARLSDRLTGNVVQDLSGHTGYLLSAAFSRDGSRLVTGATDGTTRVWSTNGESLAIFSTANSWVRAVAFSRDGKLVAAGGSDSTVHVWNLESRKELHTLPLNAGSVKAVAFAPGFDYLLAAWEDGVLRVFDSNSGALLLEFVTVSGFLNCATWSPDARYILMGEGWPTYVARLLDTDTGRVERVFAGHTYPVDSVAFDQTGTLVLTGADRVRLWSVADITSRVSVRLTTSGPELLWNRGTLQQSAGPVGPWLPVPNAVSPFKPEAAASRAFFRLSLPIED
jgi:WD40 repeat protein